MQDSSPIQSPTLEQEQERLRKWREVRRRAAADPNADRLHQADIDRKSRLDQFETDKANRIRAAETRRREEAEAVEARRMEKARAHLEALDDIETARATLINARKKSRRLSGVMFGICVGIPTLLTALFYLVIVPPVFQSTSTLAIEGAMPTIPRNPFFNEKPSGHVSMAAAFHLRAQLQSQAEQSFEMGIDTTQGLVTVVTSALTPTEAYARNSTIIKTADTLAFPARLKVLTQPTIAKHAISPVLPNTLLAFLISLSVFTIGAVFLQSFRHYARN